MLRVTDLVRNFPVRGTDRVVHAVRGVSFELAHGETLGIVGESGCGKSTAARLIARLDEPTSGRIELDGNDVTHVRGGSLRSLRRSVQLVFQDPFSSLNPRLGVADALDEVLRVHKAAPRPNRKGRVVELLEMVGLAERHGRRYPHQLSGGQRQRVVIARALAVEPRLLILDEPVSALDVSVRAEIMNLLGRLRSELGLTYIFISHDLAMVRHISDRIAVMYLGKIVEQGAWRPVSDAPLHPYTQALQSAVPVPDPELEARRTVEIVGGEPPDPAAPPPGCSFHTRCPLAEQICLDVEPPLEDLQGGHLAACHVAARAVRESAAS